MIKQEEIQEEIRTKVKGLEFKIGRHEGVVDVEIGFVLTDDDLGRIFRVMSDNGAVIGVDRELPKNPYNGKLPVWKNPERYERWMGYNKGQQDMLKAGYVAVEPLIKEIDE